MGRVLLDDSPQGELSVVGHGVALVQNNQLEPLVEDVPSRGEALDVVPHHVDASRVTRVQVERHLTRARPVHLLRDRQNHRRLPRPRGTIKQQVRKLVLVHQALHFCLCVCVCVCKRDKEREREKSVPVWCDLFEHYRWKGGFVRLFLTCVDDVFVCSHVLECLRSVLLHPGNHLHPKPQQEDEEEEEVKERASEPETQRVWTSDREKGSSSRCDPWFCYYLFVSLSLSLFLSPFPPKPKEKPKTSLTEYPPQLSFSETDKRKKRK